VSGSTCDREQELLAAVASAEIPDELRQHAAGCTECSEVLLVATFLRREITVAAPAPVPDPAYLWWRATRDRRSAAAERATRLITIVQQAAILSAALLAVPLVRWSWPHLAHWIGALNLGALAPELPASAGNPLLVIAISATLLAVLALLDLHGEWSRD
jgi:hypothetical protein